MAIVVISEERVIRARLAHPWNTPTPTLVIVDGIVTIPILAPLNKYVPSEVTVVPRTMDGIETT